MSTITQFPSGNTRYRIEFDYLARTFVVVTLVNSSNPALNRVLEVGRDYRFLNPTMIEMLVDQSGFDIVRIHRQTGTDLVVDFRNGSVLTASDLTNAELQAIHIAEEGRDQTVDLAKEYADAAGNSAGNAKDSEDEARRIAESIKASGLGYITRRSFEKGFNVTIWNEVLLWEEDGDYYRWDGGLPKTVPVGSTPETSGGVGLGAWVSVGDASLRADIAKPTGTNLIGTKTGNTVYSPEQPLGSTITQFPSGNTRYRIEFDYLARTFVVVTLVNSSNPALNRVLEVGRDYRFLNPTMIEMLVDQSGFDIVRIHRQTGTDLVVDFRNGSVLTASDLTNAELQAIHIAEEGRDQTVDLAKEYADAAGNSAGNAKDSEDEARRIAESIKASGLGYITRRSFEKGFNVTIWNEVLLWEEDGDYYRWDGGLPKTVPVGSTPETSGGVGLGAWVSVGDASLRADIAKPTGTNLIGTKTGNTVYSPEQPLGSTITQFPSGNTRYRIEFDYLARTFVVVTLVNSSNPALNRVLEVGRDYRFLNPTMIEMLVDQSGFDIVRIHRQTGTDLVVDFRNGSVLTASDLTNAELQAIHIAEEGRDQTVDLAKEYADAAGNSAGNAKDSEDEARRIAESIKASGLGYITRRSFEKGFNVTIWNEVLLWEEDGDYYRWDGGLPKTVPVGSTPETSGGVGLGAWVSVGDASLRADIAKPTGTNLIGTKTGNTVYSPEQPLG
uniref:Tail fiber protein n=1 Tax=Escherichia virus LS3 TaxID=2743777 RepID=A0A7D5JV66_9CAUD